MVDMKTFVDETIRDRSRDDAVRILQYFNVRDALFQQAASESAGTDPALQTALETYRGNGAAVRTALSKRWAPALDYDCDASYFANDVYWKRMFPSETGCPIRAVSRYEFTLHAGGVVYRGETMHSWATTLHEFYRRFGGVYLKGMVRNQARGRNHGKWRLPPDGPDWPGFLSVPENYSAALPSYLTGFLEVVYTIGNFIPIPSGCNVYTELQDYWDLKLQEIYEWYRDRDPARLTAVAGAGAQPFGRFLDGFGDWDGFVRATDQQPLVTAEGDRFGAPKELWEGHFTDPYKLPEREDEFEQFFVNAKDRILKRGKQIAETLWSNQDPS